MFSWVIYSASYHIFIINQMASGRHQKGKLTSQTLLVHKHSGLMHLEVYFMGKSFIWRFPVLLGFGSMKSNKTAVVVFWVIAACSLSWDWDVYKIAQEREHTDARHLTLLHSAKSPRRGGWPMAPPSTVIAGRPFWTALLPGKGGTTWSEVCLIIRSAYSEKNVHPNPRDWLKLWHNLS